MQTYSYERAVLIPARDTNVRARGGLGKGRASAPAGYRDRPCTFISGEHESEDIEHEGSLATVIEKKRKTNDLGP